MKRLIVLAFFIASLSFAERIKLKIPRIMCGSCTKKVEAQIRRSTGVTDLKVHIENTYAEFDCDAKKGCSKIKIIKSLNSIGYPAKEMK